MNYIIAFAFVALFVFALYKVLSKIKSNPFSSTGRGGEYKDEGRNNKVEDSNKIK